MPVPAVFSPTCSLAVEQLSSGELELSCRDRKSASICVYARSRAAFHIAGSKFAVLSVHPSQHANEPLANCRLICEKLNTHAAVTTNVTCLTIVAI